MASVRYIGCRFADIFDSKPSSQDTSYAFVHETFDFNSTEERRSECISIDTLKKGSKFAGMIGCISDRKSGARAAAERWSGCMLVHEPGMDQTARLLHVISPPACFLIRWLGSEALAAYRLVWHGFSHPRRRHRELVHSRNGMKWLHSGR